MGLEMENRPVRHHFTSLIMRPGFFFFVFFIFKVELDRALKVTISDPIYQLKVNSYVITIFTLGNFEPINRLEKILTLKN